MTNIKEVRKVLATCVYINLPNLLTEEVLDLLITETVRLLDKLDLFAEPLLEALYDNGYCDDKDYEAIAHKTPLAIRNHLGKHPDVVKVALRHNVLASLAEEMYVEFCERVLHGIVYRLTISEILYILRMAVIEATYVKQ